MTGALQVGSRQAVRAFWLVLSVRCSGPGLPDGLASAARPVRRRRHDRRRPRRRRLPARARHRQPGGRPFGRSPVAPRRPSRLRPLRGRHRGLRRGQSLALLRRHLSRAAAAVVLARRDLRRGVRGPAVADLPDGLLAAVPLQGGGERDRGLGQADRLALWPQHAGRRRRRLRRRLVPDRHVRLRQGGLCRRRAEPRRRAGRPAAGARPRHGRHQGAPDGAAPRRLRRRRGLALVAAGLHQRLPHRGAADRLVPPDRRAAAVQRLQLLAGPVGVPAGRRGRPAGRRAHHRPHRRSAALLLPDAGHRDGAGAGRRLVRLLGDRRGHPARRPSSTTTS